MHFNGAGLLTAQEWGLRHAGLQRDEVGSVRLKAGRVASTSARLTVELLSRRWVARLRDVAEVVHGAVIVAACKGYASTGCTSAT